MKYSKLTLVKLLIRLNLVRHWSDSALEWLVAALDITHEGWKAPNWQCGNFTYGTLTEQLYNHRTSDVAPSVLERVLPLLSDLVQPRFQVLSWGSRFWLNGEKMHFGYVMVIKDNFVEEAWVFDFNPLNVVVSLWFGLIARGTSASTLKITLPVLRVPLQ